MKTYVNEGHKKLTELRELGLTQTEIEKKFKISQPAIVKKLKKYVVERSIYFVKKARYEKSMKEVEEFLENNNVQSLADLSLKSGIPWFRCQWALPEKLKGNNIRKLKNIEECKRLNEHSTNEKYIPLTFGKKAVVDAETFEKINTNGWCYCQKSGNVYRKNGKATITMNRFVKATVEDIDGKIVFYKNGRKLDNKQMNLHATTFREF
jgi:hypothetical protein